MVLMRSILGQMKKLRTINGILKDGASFIKAILSVITKRHTSSIRRAILRATTHSSSSPPSDHRIASVISSGNGSRRRACACIQALMDRLHGTRNAYVALKSLYAIHNVITRGSFILKDQLSVYPSSGGRNFLNLSEFHDDSDAETWELSAWVRWYATVLEKSLMVSRVLGYYLISDNDNDNDKVLKKEKILGSLSADLLREIEALVGFLQEISNVPSSLHLQRNDLVYQIVRLVSEDYRLLQRELLLRADELGGGERLASLGVDELTLFSSALTGLEDCKERLFSLFVNRKKNHGLWDSIGKTKMKIESAANDKMALVRVIGKRESVRQWRRQPFRFTSSGSSVGVNPVS